MDPINKAYFCYKRKRILYPTLSTKKWPKHIVFKVLSLGGKNTPSSIVTLENISFLKGGFTLCTVRRLCLLLRLQLPDDHLEILPIQVPAKAFCTLVSTPRTTMKLLAGCEQVHKIKDLFTYQPQHGETKRSQLAVV